ncbi:hypothetical protein CKK34_2345 [Yarrowia sp. E02]|nr:hypothetical protein CKK34_2345 [Yarrowia sp. E02]
MDTLKNDFLCKEKLYLADELVDDDDDEDDDKDDHEDDDDDSDDEYRYRDEKDIVGGIYDTTCYVLGKYLVEKSRDLGPKTTKEEGVEAVRELLSAYESGRDLVRNTIYAEVQKELGLCIRAQRDYKRRIEAGKKDLMERLVKEEVIEAALPPLVLERYPREKLNHIGLLQAKIWCLLENTSQEVQDWWYLHHNVFTEHLIYVPKPMPKMESSRSEDTDAVRVSETSETQATSLPLEICITILAFCSLETCVALRQVSRKWYQAFLLTDLEASVKNRCPWFSLGDELRTWTECALVFVQRQKSDKWASVDSPDDFSLRPENPPYIVEPIQLELDEKLPAGFEPINDHLPGPGEHDDCDSLHLSQDDPGRFKVLDLTTMEVLEETVQEFNTTSIRRAEGTAIVNGQVEYILLPPAVEVDESHLQMFIGIYMVYVETSKTGHFIFPRQKLHWSHVHCIEKTLGLPREQTPDLVVLPWERGDRTKDIQYKNDMLHLDTGHRFSFLCREETSPVACYKGVIWWYVSGKGLVPTSVDLESQWKLKFRHDRTIPFAHENEMIDITQCTNRRFVISVEAAWDAVLIDLETATVTAMSVGYDAYSRGLIKGFVSGRFVPRFVSDSTTCEYEERYEGGSDIWHR